MESTFVRYTRYTKGFAYSDRYAYVGELKSSDPSARYDLLFPHFIDPPFYTNKLAVPPCLPRKVIPTRPDDRLSFLSSVSEIDDIRPLEIYFREPEREQARVK